MSEQGIGAALTRVEARDKVTGAARYTADVVLPGMAYAALVSSQVSAGRLRSLDVSAAKAAPGVLGVFSHLDRPTWHRVPAIPYFGETRMPFSDDRIHHAGQHIAIVVASTRQQAAHAAALVKAEYEAGKPVPTLEKALPSAYVAAQGNYVNFPQETVRGTPEEALAGSPVRVKAEYRTALISHAPIEPSVTTATWEGDELTLYDTSQAVVVHRGLVATAFGLPEDKVRLVCPLIGGAFGAKTHVWGHTLLVALAARRLGRPVQVVITRKQMFTTTGHQPPTVQRIEIGAERDGRLRVITHDSTNSTSFVAERPENTVLSSVATYAVPNLRTRVRLARMNFGTPTAMRTPGDGPGSFALECALDELAHELGADPVELRRRNHADVHPQSGKPWSGKNLLECYRIGAERFGWHRRDRRPGTRREGNDLIGYGMATARRVEHHRAAESTVDIRTDGGVVVRTATQDIGGGTLTTMIQVAADALGVAPDKVTITVGDTDLPPGAPTFGSITSGSNGSAVRLAAQDARGAAIRLAVGDKGSPLHGLAEDAVDVRDGRLFAKADPRRGETYAVLLTRNRVNPLRGNGKYSPAESQYETSTFGAHFTEVRIDRDLPRVRVVRHLAVIDCGIVLNTKTARNQAQGGIIGSIGVALMEELRQDPVSGRALAPALTDYHVPVNADIGQIDVHFVNKPDHNSNPLGAKGLGEICSIGVSAAVANAVFNATGRRIRDLPITPRRLL
ncbi:xanthine dehydrogenase family protein molybdopterin-binding subunit [Allokutzneria sp. A3M-2-11 16]|uniref:xanthine dehydrogenase family protein molybdopterin-binding subunit n=1 Tax=Allokutzneria sp. A3M-2-11 16 TaxID=2962043 RepID=UPI0020B81A7E|nr:molybdopterin cofactor-binding domain-containing protein [Allokutzneria sp. A3M-2-11 16]MCP3802268.1 xanthine dehydrogenase family protein molybdopterin-binding subunit [Allokutzneria sp. A3M-2-11 16]